MWDHRVARSVLALIPPAAVLALALMLALDFWASDAASLPTLQLDKPLPPVLYSPQLKVSGSTRDSAFVVGLVDGQSVWSAFALGGRFDLSLPIPEPGYHSVEITASYADPNQPNERVQSDVIRAESAPPAPVLLAVRPARADGWFPIAVALSPGADLVVRGGRTETAEPRFGVPSIKTNRASVNVLPDSEGKVSLFAKGEVLSAESGPYDLAALARAKTTSAGADDTHWTIAYSVDRSGIARTRTIKLNPSRPELRELLEGRVDVGSFLDIVGGRAGIALDSGLCGGVSNPATEKVAVEVGELATVTLEEDFPGLLRALNQFSDRAELQLCFPDGMPLFGTNGELTVAVSVSDFRLDSVLPAEAGATAAKSAAGVDEVVYTWKRLSPGDHVVLRLTRDVPSTLALIPGLRVGDLLTKGESGAAISNVVYSIVQSAGVFLLLWVVATKHSRRYLLRRPRIAMSGLLTVAAAVALLPVASGLARVTKGAVPGLLENAPWLVDRASSVGVNQDLLGVFVVGALAVAFSGIAAIVFHRLEFGYPALVAIACALSITVILAILFASSVSLFAAEPLEVSVATAERRTTLAICATLVFCLLLYARRQLGAFSGWPGAQTSSRWLRDLLWISAIAILVSLPAGLTPFVARDWTVTSVATAVSEVQRVTETFVLLLVSATALFAVFAMVPFVQRAFRRARWERLVFPDLRGERWIQLADDAPPVGVAVAGRREGLEVAFLRIGLVLFAGYIIGTAGVFAVLPIPFLVAFLAFGWLLSTRVRAERLARIAPAVRRTRLTLIRSWLRPNPAPVAAAPPDTEGTEVGEQEPLASLSMAATAALGPARLPWVNAAFALKAGTGLVVGLLVLYLIQNPFGSLTRYDPFYVQRFVLAVVSFAGSWLIIGFFFGLMYEYLIGTSGVQKGIRLGFVILALTVPFQLLSLLGGQATFVSISLRMLQVLAFTVLLGAAFDLRLLNSAGLLKWSDPKRIVTDLGTLSGAPQLTVAVTFVASAALATLGALLTGQVTELLTRALSPFLPIPTT